MTKIPDISIVVPVFNSEKIILELVKRIRQAMSQEQLSYELILINDASTDGSKQVLDVVVKEDKNVIVSHNEKNLGQAYTSIKGIGLSHGNYIVTIDDDLEYEPADIMKLYQEIQSKNYEVIFGIAPNKYNLQGKSTRFAFLRNKILNFLWRKPVTDSFKIFKRSLAFNENEYLIQEPFEKFMTKTVQRSSIAYVEVGFNERYWGKSNYTLVKKFKLFLDMSK